MGQMNRFEAGQRSLLVASAIYLPYQHIDAVRTRGPLHLDVETVVFATIKYRQAIPRVPTAKRCEAPFDQLVLHLERRRLLRIPEVGAVCLLLRLCGVS